MMSIPYTNWCHKCGRWTDVHETPEDHREGDFECGSCGELYRCDECGFEIDRHGNCLRTVDGMGGCPAGDRYAAEVAQS